MYRYTRNSQQHAFRSQSPITNEQIAIHAPAILADRAHESRSARYGFIPTINVLDGLRREGFMPFEVRQTKARTADKLESTKHLIRLRHVTQLEKQMATREEVPEIILLNSHDGTSSYKLISGVFRMVCSNGLIAGDIKHDVTIRHSGNVVDNVIEGSYEVLDELQNVIEHVDNFKGITLSQDEQRLLADAAIALRFDPAEENDEGEKTGVMVRPEQLLVPWRQADRADDLWTTFNRVQENVIKGGVRTVNAKTHRRGSSKEVTSITENVRLNRALWLLADGMAKLKTAA